MGSEAGRISLVERARKGRLVNPPWWAIKLVETACDTYNSPVARLSWRIGAKRSGTWAITYFDGRVSVSCGWDPIDARITLIHEIAHHIQYQLEGKMGHVDGYYELFWELTQLFRMPLTVAVETEVAYMAEAEKALISMGLRLGPEGQLRAKRGKALRQHNRLKDNSRRLAKKLKLDRNGRPRPMSQEGADLYVRMLEQVKTLSNACDRYQYRANLVAPPSRLARTAKAKLAAKAYFSRPQKSISLRS